MFKKIVSRLPFSPSLINELGFYAKRLQKEELTRRTGLILTALALVVQSLAVFVPPESANAANNSDLVRGGLHNRVDVLAACAKDTEGFKQLLNHAGIQCTDLANAKFTEINSRSNGKDNGWLSWNRVARFGLQRGERAVSVGDQTIYVRPLAAFDTGKNQSGSGSFYKAFVGKTSAGKDFALMTGCANIVLKEYPPSDTNIKVCDIVSKKIITIRQSAFNAAKHSKNLADCQEKNIAVCDLASKTIVTIGESSFDSKRHSKNLDDCKEKPNPTALCSSLTIEKLERTKIKLQANASTANGATITGYTFIIKDKSGKEVLRKQVTSTGPSAQLQHVIAKDGSYSAEVIVATSMGNQTSTACQAQFTISPIERCPLNPSLPINDPDCQPCPADPTIWVKDEDCAAQIIRAKKAMNLTTAKDATKDKARSSERIEYMLTARNEGKAPATFDMSDDLSDVLEYATLYDRGGGKLDEQTKILSWSGITLKPGEEQTRTYVVQLASQISPMPQGSSDASSYDCRMTNHFGNTTDVYVDCPTPKVIEQVVEELPETGAGANMIFAGIFGAVATFFYFRSKQLNKEVRLIRREVTAGTI